MVMADVDDKPTHVGSPLSLSSTISGIDKITHRTLEQLPN